jgi:hypothetical protein
MKLSKSDLKVIVKECLVEILNEGLGGVSPAPVAALPRFQKPVASALSDSLKRQSPPRATPQLREAIRREAGGDKVMEAILADTAASTLPKFLQSGDGKTPMPTSGGGIAEQVVAQTNPEDLFGGDVTSKWASLAFMDSPTKK